MNKLIINELDALTAHYPELEACRSDIVAAFTMLSDCHRNGGLIMTCGNGGSAADAEHIVGELMKGFKNRRCPTPSQREALTTLYGAEGETMASSLQQAIRAVSLVSQTALSSAFINDVAADMVFAQQVFGYGRAGDVLVGLSTSGNSANVVKAAMTARAFGLHTVALTGEDGGRLRQICNVCIRVPARETYRVQEYHLPVYHALCAMLEKEFFG